MNEEIKEEIDKKAREKRSKGEKETIKKQRYKMHFQL